MSSMNNSKGFTFLEVIVVLIFLGIMAILVVNRASSLNAEIYAGADALKAHIRYAQTVAMNTHEGAGIAYDSATNQYWMYRGNDETNVMLLPDDAQFTTADRKIDLNAKKIRVNQGFNVYFNNRGVPYEHEQFPTMMTQPLKLSVTAKSDGTSKAISIEPLTGYVP